MTNLKSGLSGCKIELLSDNILRKYSSNIEYNERLRSQMRKQSLFSHFILQNIDTPTIYQINEDEIISYDMEYVSGFSFDEYFTHASVKNVDSVLQSLFGYFDFLIEYSKIYHKNLSKSIILEKLHNIDIEKNDFFMFIVDKVNSSDLKFPYSFCHGDLTFSNIIFHPNRLYFIDFLDSFIDSYLIDFAKLKQDLYYFWNLKIQKINNLRIYQIYEYIWNNLEIKYFKYLNTIEFKILDSINLLRIKPYLTNNEHHVILNRMIEETFLYEDFNCTYGRKI